MDWKWKRKRGNKWIMDISKPAHNNTFANMAGLVVKETFDFK